MHPQICELGLGGRQALEPTTWFRIMGKEISFHKIGLIMISKRIDYMISTIFFFRMGKR